MGVKSLLYHYQTSLTRATGKAEGLWAGGGLILNVYKLPLIKLGWMEPSLCAMDDHSRKKSSKSSPLRVVVFCFL